MFLLPIDWMLLEVFKKFYLKLLFDILPDYVTKFFLLDLLVLFNGWLFLLTLKSIPLDADLINEVFLYILYLCWLDSKIVIFLLLLLFKLILSLPTDAELLIDSWDLYFYELIAPLFDWFLFLIGML